MSPARVRRRFTRTGESRWQVVYRLGGRGFPELYAGTFARKTEAITRRDLVAGELAAGRDPQTLLRDLQNPKPRTTVGQQADAWHASRIDIDEATRKNHRAHIARLKRTLGDREPGSVSWQDVQALIVEHAADLAPGTVRSYFVSWRAVLDYAGVDPNPARDPRIRLPHSDREEPSPPTRSEFHKIADWLDGRRPTIALLLRLVEATAIRVGEACALQWGDVDVVSGRLRISVARTKGRTGGQRWVQVPDALMGELEQLLPLEDRSRERRVFDVGRENVGKWMRRACKASGIADYTPRDLRHRRLSLWSAQGVPRRVIQDRAGHDDLQSQDTYTHVVIDPADDDWYGGAA